MRELPKFRDFKWEDAKEDFYWIIMAVIVTYGIFIFLNLLSP